MHDREMIADFIAHRSPETFAAVVQNYGSMVYSSARRQVGDSHLAEDVTQAVFILLWRKAAKVPGEKLAAWLLRATFFASRDARKLRARRQFHERQAAEMRSEQTSGEPAWEDYSPDLDAALATLASKDRQAIALRFLRGLKLGEVGQSMEITEEAARKRVDRAIERLRAAMSAKTSVPTAAALTADLTAHGSAPAPPELLAAIPLAAAGAAKGTLAWAIAQKAGNIMTWIKIKIVTVIAATVILAGATTTTIVVYAATNNTAPLPAPAVAVAVPQAPVLAPAQTTASPGAFTPITLHVKNADARDVLQQIAKQGGKTLKLWPDWSMSGRFGNGTKQLTLDIDNQPFWSAIGTFCAATGSKPFSSGDRDIIEIVQAIPSEAGLGGISLQSGALTVVAEYLTHNRSTRLTDLSTQRDDDLALILYVDPSVRVLNYGNFAELNKAVDENGNSFLPSAARTGEHGLVVSPFNNWSINTGATLQYPPNPGRTLTDIAGTVQVLLASHVVPLVMDHLADSTGKTISQADHSLTLDAFSLQPLLAGNCSGSIRITLRRSTSAANRDVPLWTEQTGSIALVDGAGNRMEIPVSANGSGNDTAEASGNFTASLDPATVKLRWNLATQSRMELLPFEFKNLPLPAE